jgi:glycosyltransferase involved in cell wall biosynthesis
MEAMGREFELVLPCYNEAQSLTGLVQRAVTAAKEAGHTPGSFGLVLVQNGSTDESPRVLAALLQTDLGVWVKVVTVTPNEGYGNGLWQGLKATTAPYVGWSHADLQCDPKDALTALTLLKSGHLDTKLLVKGHRRGRSLQDRFVSAVFAQLARVLLGVAINEINAQPKVFPRGLLQEILDPPKNFPFDLYVLYRALKAGYQVRTVPVLFPPRVHGLSKWAATFAGRYKTILGFIAYMRRLALREGRL